ncbi:hypothetical protein SISNIDRAFT_472591 [Sistotremastrum niveocremeum HHB9708]|uniref:ARM repeat-containing protein n=1 Tax=Sistotremastrum niveocremeum HHB9708 TaxID=1314777 RepID=A0A164ZDB0_9AGAM|nr:hypothetical protein SISNIDRAFT_472591 [Sistotremastrum niveocremeum HHB9708]
MADVTSVLKTLEIPSEFSLAEDAKTSDITLQLRIWKDFALQGLRELQRLNLEATLLSRSTDSVSTLAQIIPFEGTSEWTSESHRTIAQELLKPLAPPDAELVSEILIQHVKPAFMTAPHPMLDTETGRKLPRTAGGSLATQDFYEHQRWKSKPWVADLVSWCIRNLASSDYERYWHLIIPPTMTMLDDLNGAWRIRGVELVSELLEHVPPELLRRTGVDRLISSSLHNVTGFLHNPETPQLIEIAVPVFIQFVKKTTAPGSSARFEELSSLLGKGIIGTVWAYASRDQATIEVSVRCLPHIFSELGIGAARYMKSIVPQLLFLIVPEEFRVIPSSSQLAALSALTALITHMPTRISGWKADILDGVCRRWVVTQETHRNNEMEAALKGVCRALEAACPELKEVGLSLF